MADLQNFSVTEGSPAQINVPTHNITAQVFEGQTLVADYTGQSAIRWPEVLGTLSTEQRAEILDLVATRVVLMKAGL